MVTPEQIKARLGRNPRAATELKSAALREVQTDRAQVGYVEREWDAHPTSGLTPGRLAEIMRNAEQGQLTDQFDLADDIEEKDAHVMAELAKRKNALLSKPWQIVAPPGASAAEERDAAMVTDMINSLPDFEDLVLDLGDGILRGMANSQIHWEQEGKLWYPGRFESVPARRFTVSDENRNQVLLRLDGGLTEPLWPLGWIAHSHKAKSGYLARAGLIRVLAWPFLFKNYSVRDLAEFLEIYGLPLRLGKYPAGASKDEKSTLLQAVMSIGHNAGGIIPKGMEIEFQEAAKGGSDPYMAMMGWAERSQSKAILGGTLTSQADGNASTNALGNVHNEVRQELLASDLRQLASTLTRDLVWPLVLLNGSTFNSQRRRPRLVFDTQDPESLEQYASAIPSLVQIGVKIPSQWVNEKLKIPLPKEGEAVLGMSVPSQEQGRPQPEPEPEPEPESETAQQETALSLLQIQPLARAIAALKQLPPRAAELTPLTDSLASVAGEQLDREIAELVASVDKAKSWDEVEQALIGAYSDRGAVALAAILQQAMGAAALAGRYDVELGN